jgi:hypothetical protein
MAWHLLTVDFLGNFGTPTLAITVIHSGGLFGESSSAGRQDGESSAGIP